MNIQGRGGREDRMIAGEHGGLRLAPLAQAIALALTMGGAIGNAVAAQPFSAGWYAGRGALQDTARATGMVNGKSAASFSTPAAQQQQASAQLKQSIANLSLAAHGIAMMQAQQAAWRQAALGNPSSIPDGLGVNGLDTGSLASSWINASAPTQSTDASGKIVVDIVQTADKAIANWESFNVGKNTIVQFDQASSDWAILNRISDPSASPSQIQGQIRAPGTVLIVNRNGIVFYGSSQINTRNLVAAAADISDSQFTTAGIYGASQAPSFTNASGKLIVEAGAQITTGTPSTVTQGGGYVLLMGQQVSNAGDIATPKGQVELAAGDNFIIRKGAGTDANQSSTTRGNEISPQLNAGSTAGQVVNTGLLLAREGDVTLAGHDVQQNGVAVATTSVNTRGTIHLLNSASDSTGLVTLGAGAVTAVALSDDGATALDSQRAALIAASPGLDNTRLLAAAGVFNNLSSQTDRQDQSRVEIVSGGDVRFDGTSLTLATGGQIAVSAAHRSFVADGAILDVSGQVGVNLAMSSNNVVVNVQGNELRDSPDNRDSGNLFNSNITVDRRDLILVPAGDTGAPGDRWYTANGLLEVSGYLNNQGHTIGEWAAQGGTIQLSGNEVVTQSGSQINLSGGSLNVATGYVAQTWLVGSDGNLYTAGNAPANMTFSGVYKGFEVSHPRWGKDASVFFYNPLIAPQKRLENGYTVGRDAGQLIVNAPTAVMEGDVIATVYQGPQQVRARDAVADNYLQSQTAAPRQAGLLFGQYGPGGLIDAWNSETRIGQIANVADSLSGADALPADRIGTVWLDAGRLSAAGLGEIDIATKAGLTIDAPFSMADGGIVNLIAPVIGINADVTARGGSFTATNRFVQAGQTAVQAFTLGGEAGVTLGPDAMLDLRGLWVNAALDADDYRKQSYIDGGTVRLESSGNVTISKGSVIDVSSGAALLSGGKTKGGRGGDVALIADAAMGAVASSNGTVVLNGDIRAYGVNGGGTLQVESGIAIVIGGQALKTADVLGEGEKAPVNLTAVEDFVVHAGEILPTDYKFTISVAPPGQPIGAQPAFSTANPVKLAADWTPPRLSTSSYTILLSDGTRKAINPFGAIVVIPKDSVIVGITDPGRVFPKTYVVPADAFPNGIPIPPSQTVIRAGNPAPNDVTFAAGTVILAGFTVSRPVAVQPLLNLSADLLHSGFSGYDLNGHQGIVVPAGVALTEEVPVYQITAGAFDMPTGTDPSDAMRLWTPPLYATDDAMHTITQRIGGDLTLRSARSLTGGPIVIASGASVEVDPGHAISLTGRDTNQITVDGRLDAWGGSISIDVQPLGSAAADPSVAGPGIGHNRSIWIGDNAVLDVAARPVTAQERNGRRYGYVPDGGTISIGGGLDWEDSGQAASPDVAVIIRPGAILDASGAAAVLDQQLAGLPRTPVALPVASNGGSIILKSGNALYLDGTLLAKAGGEGAAGGTLAVALETPVYSTGNNKFVDDIVRQPREFVLAGQQGVSVLDPALVPGAADPALKYGVARLGVDKIENGGFGNLSLLSDGLLSFDGDVTLHLTQSLRLYANAYGLTEGAAASARVALSAPYVRLASDTRTGGNPNDVMPTVIATMNGGSTQPAGARFSVAADLIDIREDVGFGAHGSIALNSGPAMVVDRRGFDQIDLSSSGDVRFLQAATVNGTSFDASHDLTVTAAQLYPMAGATAFLRAADTLTVMRSTDVIPDMPWSVFGFLTLDAQTVSQGGIVRAPAGVVTVGINAATTDLLPDSITSVSMNGLTMPYGGTVDGLTWKYNGKELFATDVTGMTISGDITSGVSLGGGKVDVRRGALVDVSGGGTLLGAGFVSGRGGSVDVLKHPLIDANPAYGFSDSGNAVYAIVPGFKGAYAPVSPDSGAGNPEAGRQVTVSDGVPGLPAGVYTLLPSDYALLPGAFRVEIGAAGVTPQANGAAAAGNGTYVTAGYLGTANTAIRSALPSRLIISSADAVRAYSQYNETGYADFAMKRAAELGNARPLLPIDGKLLRFAFNDSTLTDTALHFDGTALFNGANGGLPGYSSIVLNTVERGGIEILGPAGAKTAGYVSLEAGDLNAIGAPRMVIGGWLYNRAYPGNVISLSSNIADLIVRSGAVLTGPDIMLATGVTNVAAGLLGRVLIEDGAKIDTVGQGNAPFNSSDGYIFNPLSSTVLAISNGWMEFLPPQPDSSDFNNGGPISIGGCLQTACSGIAEIYSEGTIALASSRAISIDPSARYGTKNLALSVSSINIGSEASLASAAASGVLPGGLSMNQGIFDRLLAGNAGDGIPKLESLTLTAAGSVNFFGTVDLSTLNPVTGKSTLGEFVLNTPAIYGYGNANDVATLTTDTFVWNGVSDVAIVSGNVLNTSAPPGAVIPGGPGTGSGSLNIVANAIELGYADRTRPDTQVALDRLMLGFANANLTASSHLSGNNKGSLSVYQSQSGFVAGEGYHYSGGNLSIITPLLTGAAGSELSISAGDALKITAPAGADLAAANSDALGASLNLKGGSIDLASAVVLPGGVLRLTADGDISLRDSARIDMSGRAVRMFDVTQYSWGGDVIIESASGNVVQGAGSLIDLSAENNNAGKLSVTALGDTAGHINLDGNIRGGASGRFDAGGGAMLAFLSGEVDLHGQTIGNFAGLNQRLDAGGVSGSREFQIRQGNLVVSNAITASSVTISVDGGSLTVDGTINAGGDRVGAIRLAARDGLALSSQAVLDAHGTVLRVDSDQDAIDSPNRAIVELTSASGIVSLGSGAIIDLRAADGVARGTLTINAPRLGGADSSGAGAGANDIAIQAAGPLDIRGAAGIIVNGFRRYTDAPTDTQQNAAEHFSQIITQDYLNGIDADSRNFMQGALGNTGLMSRLAGLRRYTDAFHLRPGVEIASATADGDLTIAGDLNLAGYRYDSLNPHNARSGIEGSGEPGSLVIRAGGDLNIYGSITDGFATPPATLDGKGFSDDFDTSNDSGWYLSAGVDNYNSEVVLPKSVTLAVGTTISTTGTPTLNYDLPIGATSIRLGVVIPMDVTTNASFALPAGTVLRADITLPDSTVLKAGVIIGAGINLPAGTKLGAGTVLPGVQTAALAIQGTTVPKGTRLDIFLPASVTLSQDWELLAGSVIPSNSSLQFQNGAGGINLRDIAADGTQGKSWAVAPMLAQGSLSWDMTLVAGADQTAADTHTLRAKLALGTSGDMTLSDIHAMANIGFSAQPMLISVIRTGTGDLNLLAGGDFNQQSLYGIYTAGTQSAAIDANGNAAGSSSPYDLPRATTQLDFNTGLYSVLGANFDSSYEAAVTGANYHAWYPEHGGNVRVSVGGTMTGALFETGTTSSFASSGGASFQVGNWLWTQGGASQQTAWWINFGTYVVDAFGFTADQPGFSGIGTLGGGNVSIAVGGDAGIMSSRGGSSFIKNTQGLNVAVGSTGRVLADGTVVKTGGGDLDIDIGGSLNPLHWAQNQSSGSNGAGPVTNDLNGIITDLRGRIDLRAGQIGRIDLSYGVGAAVDPRVPETFTPNVGRATGGPLLMPGDSIVEAGALRDLVISGVGNPGFSTGSWNFTYAGFSDDGSSLLNVGNTFFSLWTSRTSLSLASIGGNLAPYTRSNAPAFTVSNEGNTLSVYAPMPPSLIAVATSGSIYLDGRADLVASPTGQLEMLAGKSIYGDARSVVTMSGADPARLYSPLNPHLMLVDPGAGQAVTDNQPYSGLDTVTENLHGNDATPIRFYGLTGDILGISVGGTQLSPDGATLYQVAKPVVMRAGRDIVNTSGLILNNNIDDVSSVAAGRDIIHAGFDIAGPGLFVVSAGRNITQEDKASVTGIGPLVPGDTRAGAGIFMQAGAGAAGPDYAALAKLYLNPGNLADPSRPLADQPGKVVRTYESDLVKWLADRYGFAGTVDDARTYFNGLDQDVQNIFLRQVYFAELTAGGREYNDVNSTRLGSYLRGRQAIAALFPEVDANGRPVSYGGDITMSGGSGVQTDFGGDVQMLAPGGQIVIGVEGLTPPPTAGVVTQGAGDIQMYSQGSVLLGLSRMMTTFGGDILAWSATGDINAGRGSKTTVLFTPPRRVYDDVGDVALAPQAPSSGAGIATLNPIPEVPAGDVDLIAPLGTIDAGEAGIRVSGNVNLAALQVVNAANIQVQGKSTGLPLIATVNVNALTNASAAATQAAMAAQDVVSRERTAARQALPSIFTVRVLGFGNEPARDPGTAESSRQQSGLQSGAKQYDMSSMVQIVGLGNGVDPVQSQRLTDAERRSLKLDQR